ncbi:MAG: glycosyltransferase family 2 protein [Phormidesmis sp.]
MLLRMLLTPINKLRLSSLKRSARHLHGPLEVPTTRTEAVVLCVVRDGESLVQAFIEHYLSLGFRHIFFLDNGSTDGTRTIISSYKETTLVSSNKPFSRYYILFKNYLIQTFGRGQWCVVADIDEFLHLPHNTPLENILTYLNSRDYDTVCIQMLDMFSKSELSLRDPNQENKQITNKRWTLRQLKSVFCYYDLKDLDRRRYVRWFQPRVHPAHRFFYGGIRKTTFNRDCFLTKETMFFGRKSTRLVSSHLLKRSNLADFSCVFLHYKFTEDFYASTLKAVAAENHWRNSYEYKAYLEVLTAADQKTGLALYQPSSQKLENTDDLNRAGFLFSSDELTTFLAEAVSGRCCTVSMTSQNKQ